MYSILLGYHSTQNPFRIRNTWGFKLEMVIIEVKENTWGFKLEMVIIEVKENMYNNWKGEG